MSKKRKNTTSKTYVSGQLAVLVIAGVIFALNLFGAMLSVERSGSDTRFRELAEQRIIATRANIAIAESSIQMLVGFFSATPPGSISRGDFKTIMEPTLSTQPFVQAYSWNPRVSLQDRPAFEKAAQKNGLVDFHFTERNADGKFVPAAERPEYVPVYYIEPFSKNQAALGFDLTSNPIRRAALEAGKASGTPQACGRITLVQEYSDQYGILILAPVFSDKGPDASAAHGRTLIGYISGVFRLGDLINFTDAQEEDSSKLPLVDIHLYDMSAQKSEQILYPKSSTLSPDELKSHHKVYVSKLFEVAGRRWLLIATPSATFQASARPFTSYMVLSFALLVVLLLAIYLKGRITQTANATAFARKVEQAGKRLHEAQKIAGLVSLEVDCNRSVFLPEEGAVEMLGLPPGREWRPIREVLDWVHPDDRKLAENVFFSTAEKRVDGEFRMVRDGSQRILHAWAGERTDRESIVVSLLDVTRRRLAEEERASMIALMSEANRLEALGTLASGIAHEINTPAQYIGDNLVFLDSGYHDMIPLVDATLDLVRSAKERQDPTAAIEKIGALAEEMDLEYLRQECPLAIENSRQGIKQISGIVRAMKEFSHPSEKGKSFVDINHIVENTLAISRNTWKHIARLETRLDPQLQMVKCLPGGIGQVLLNLIVNAAQALDEAGRTAETGTIAVSTSQEDGMAVISIADNANGIPEDVRPKIFNPFFTTKAIGKGTGQGLAISRDIVVQKHGGTLDFETEPGKGTTFRIKLPIVET